MKSATVNISSVEFNEIYQQQRAAEKSVKAILRAIIFIIAMITALLVGTYLFVDKNFTTFILFASTLDTAIAAFLLSLFGSLDRPERDSLTEAESVQYFTSKPATIGYLETLERFAITRTITKLERTLLTELYHQKCEATMAPKYKRQYSEFLHHAFDGHY